MEPEPLPGHTQLIEQLRTAFPPEPINPDGAFRDWGTTYLDVEPYQEHLDGESWENLDHSYLIQRYDALGFLGTRHLVAVLPVYLRSIIEQGVWSVASGTVIIILTKPGPEQKTGIKLPRFQAFVDALTAAQRTVIAEVLRAFAAVDEGGSPGMAASTALERYWKTYLPDGS